MTDQDEAPTRLMTVLPDDAPDEAYELSWGPLALPVPMWAGDWVMELRGVPWRSALTLWWFGYFTGVVTIAVAVIVGFYFALS